jgi:hypothetical protein
MRRLEHQHSRISTPELLSSNVTIGRLTLNFFASVLQK